MGNICSCGKGIPRKKDLRVAMALFRLGTKEEKCQFVLIDKEANNLLLRRMNEKDADFSEEQSITLMSHLFDVSL